MMINATLFPPIKSLPVLLASEYVEKNWIVFISYRRTKNREFSSVEKV